VSLQPGNRLAHYEVVAPLGKGGMGEVYRAKDTKLGREVAIKVLPEEFGANADRLARFQREATVLASLNHPNIGSIYGLEEAGSERFLVLELVPGDTLADRLQKGRLPLAEAFDLAGQIADALSVAHDRGIIHRDLKPSNIKVTPEGQVKVLDFGLAKALAEETDDRKLSDSPTLSAHATRVGVILGTAAYMSPEQARGKSVDKRSDIFSFGAVLYEMLAGRQLFQGEDAADTMASVIRSDPDFRALPADVPPRVREILARCLEKDPKKRRRDIGDIRAELSARQEPRSAEATSRGTRLLLLVGGAAALSFFAGVAGWHLKPDSPRPIRRFEMIPSGYDFFSSAAALALSPRGTHLVYVANNQLYLRALDQIDAVPIRGSENGRVPFFSPDGSSVGFWANGTFKKIALTGGAPVQLCESEFPYGASWAADGTIVYATQKGIWEVSENGGAPTELVAGSNFAEYYYGPRKLPGGNVLLVTVNESLRDWDDAAIVALRLDTGERKTLVQGGSDARYIPTGHLVYAVSSMLYVVAFDPGELEVSGGPVPVVEGVMRSIGSVGIGRSGVAQFSVSDDGTLAFAPGEARSEQSLFWVDRSGQASRITDRTGYFATPRVSPEGKRVAVTAGDGTGTDVWIVDLERETFTQLTTDGSSQFPDWSPDGEWLVLTSATDLFRVRSDFSGPPEPLVERDGLQVHPRWMPDGRGLLFQQGISYAADLWVLDLGGDGAEPRPFLQTSFNEAQPDLSPDGRFLAYHSSVSGGTSQIFVQSFDGPGERIQVSTDEGVSPRWSPTGREIFYHGRERQALMAVEIETDPGLRPGVPRVLFEWPLGFGFSREYDVAPDGQHFVVLGTADSKEESRPRIQIVLNWFEELERLVPND
jgi:serine/threonine-protein kinase